MNLPEEQFLGRETLQEDVTKDPIGGSQGWPLVGRVTKKEWLTTEGVHSEENEGASTQLPGVCKVPATIALLCSTVSANISPSNHSQIKKTKLSRDSSR